jgi:Tfp pilus assembly protein PilO
MSNIVATAFLIIAVAIFAFFTNPRWSGVTGSADFSEKSVAELRKDEVEYASALEKTREIERVRSGLLTVYNSIASEDLERLKRLVPDHVDTIRLLLDIQRTAALRNLLLTDISLGADREGGNGSQPPTLTPGIGPVETRGFDTIELGFTVSGTYESFVAFLRDLEESLRVVDIVNLTFDSSKGLSYQFEINLRTYKLASPR